MAAVAEIKDRYKIELLKWSSPTTDGVATPKWWVCKCVEATVTVYRCFSLTLTKQQLETTFYNKFRSVFENDLAVQSDVYEQYLVGATSIYDPKTAEDVVSIFTGEGAVQPADITLAREYDDVAGILYTVNAGAVQANYWQINVTSS